MRKSIHILLTICAATALSACLPVNVSDIDSIENIASNYSGLVGKEAEVFGYLRLDYSHSELWADEETYRAASKGNILPDDPIWKKCITIYGINENNIGLFTYSNNNVVVRGVVEYIPYEPNDVPLAGCGELGINVYDIRYAN
jgi:hypothetical protein